jgi:hypothetical protein
VNSTIWAGGFVRDGSWLTVTEWWRPFYAGPS